MTETESAMPPASNADAMETRSVRLPPSLWAACEEFAVANGEKLSETYRRVFTLGISEERERRIKDLEYRNKVLVNERLEAKKARVVDLVEVLADNDDPELRKIANAFREWLGK